MRFSTLAVFSAFAGLLCAQTRIETRTTTTKTNWNGTLVDATCQRTNTVTTNSRGSTTTRTEVIECPVTSDTRSYGLLTSDGKYVRFDDSSNARVAEMIRSDRNRFGSGPMRVSVVGTANGDVAIIESLSPDDASTTTAGQDLIFDVRDGDDRGKLVLTSQGVNFENLSDAKHSRRWTYAQIKELKRKGSNEIEIEPVSGDDLTLRVDGAGMSDTAYKMVGDRIAAARAR